MIKRPAKQQQVEKEASDAYAVQSTIKDEKDNMMLINKLSILPNPHFLR
jgi:hypothetical protein